MATTRATSSKKTTSTASASTAEKKVSAKKTVTSKAAPKKVVTEKKVAKETVRPITKKIAGDLNVSVYGPKGEVTETMTMPKEVFGASINEQLIAQAVRVHLINKRETSAHTKTRGEVEGSTRKIFRQKGTGRARHGSIRAHIFVGGGVAFGPRVRTFEASLPTKMKRVALVSALSKQTRAGKIKVVDGWETLEPKTKYFASLLSTIGSEGRVLMVTDEKETTLWRGMRNIDRLTLIQANQLYTYAVASHSSIIFTKQAVAKTQKTFTQTEKTQ